MDLRPTIKLYTGGDEVKNCSIPSSNKVGIIGETVIKEMSAEKAWKMREKLKNKVKIERI